MSYCRKEGKDTIIFATEDILSSPSTTQLRPDNPDELDTSSAGAILPNGEINWDCPCLGNLPNGPCGENFRKAFSCWVEHKDNEESFAEKCFENFTKWEECISEHKDIYRPTEEKKEASNNDENEINNTNESASIDSIDKNNAHSTSQTRAIAAASSIDQKQ
uniref:Mitochondrial intermembrane space import and assembly protein 40-A-like n=1 Tax=Ciona intestinalis TaxID=7719 RepID=F6XC11_CIOIN|nr:mitochondrial intermembrane space import and assembly protein 40-A-like isoform X2 [Ciona intestinalis]|eukprot:XP_002125847.1 mitochondrial intermembrane space import and assembly protein 40-A-like isoform X2 [Ciona intestinalis]